MSGGRMIKGLLSLVTRTRPLHVVVLRTVAYSPLNTPLVSRVATGRSRWNSVPTIRGYAKKKKECVNRRCPPRTSKWMRDCPDCPPPVKGYHKPCPPPCHPCPPLCYPMETCDTKGKREPTCENMSDDVRAQKRLRKRLKKQQIPRCCPKD